MTVQQHEVIDFVALDPQGGAVLLVMVESREWGEGGKLLPDLQEKMNTYYSYVTEGRLHQDFPQSTGRAVRIELRSSVAPGFRELEFLRIAKAHHLDEVGIELRWKVIGEAETHDI